MNEKCLFIWFLNFWNKLQILKAKKLKYLNPKIEIHHIDGDRFNNNLSNLMILCPNCHSKTDNYSGKKTKSENNKKKVKEKEKKIKENKKKCSCGNFINSKSTNCNICYVKWKTDISSIKIASVIWILFIYKS